MAAQGYIGRAPGDSSVIVARQTFTPTGITTNFTFASGYTVGYVDAYLNGARLIEGSDYTATDGSVVGLTTHAQNGDVLELVVYKAFNVGDVTGAKNDFSVGGDLSVTGVSTFTGAITATGGITGAVTGDATGLSGTPDITIRNLTGVAATFTGVLSYDDVTNVDAVGYSTFREGINVQGAGSTTTTLNVSGVTTMTGDVNLGADFNIPDAITHVGDTNTKIRFPAGDTFTVETGGSEALRVDSSQNTTFGTTSESSTSVNITASTSGSCLLSFNDTNSGQGGIRYFHSTDHMQFHTADAEKVRITSAGEMLINPAEGTALGRLTVAGDGKDITFGRTQNSGTGGVGRLVATGNIVYIQAGANASSGSAADLVFGAYGGVGEKMRIMSDGTVKIGAGTGNPILMLSASTSGTSVIQMGDTADNNIGQIHYANSDDSMRFFTNNSEKLRITSAARFGFNTINPPRDYCFHSGQADTNIQITNNTTGVDDSAGALIQQDGNDLYIWNKENSFMSLGTNAGERFRISNIGHITTKGNNQGNPVGIEIRNVNSNAYSHAELKLTSQNATTSKIWCDVPNSGMRLNYNGGSSVKIDQSGNLHMPNGAGIDFSATANSSGSMASELLDDYEEGNWTPSIDNLTNTPTYDNLSGRYTRIGRTVHLMGFIQINGTTTPTYSNESSPWSLSGLPYARSSTGACGYVAARGIIHGQNFQYNGSFNDYGTTGVVNIGFVSTTALGLYVTGSGNGTIRGQVRRSSMKNTFIIEFDIVYNA